MLSNRYFKAINTDCQWIGICHIKQAVLMFSLPFQMGGKVLWCLVLAGGLLNLAFSQSGTYFVPGNKVYASYSNWVLTFSFSLDSLQGNINEISKQVQVFKDSCLGHFTLTASIVKTNDSEIQNLIRSYAALLQAEFIQFEHDITTLKNMYSLIHQTATNDQVRPKRAVIPIIGDALSWLFGTASASDLSKLQSGLDSLRQSQENIIHVVDESLTIMNKTRGATIANRKAINTLILSSQTLMKNINVINDVLQSKLGPNLKYTQLSTKLQHMHHLISNSLAVTKDRLFRVLTDIENCFQGKLPFTFVPPRMLRGILRKIDKMLPPTLKLPQKILTTKHLNWYYTFLPVTIVPGRSDILIMTTIPLVGANSQYQLFKAVSVPIPHPNGKLAASYNLEAPYIAISADKASYVLLKDEEAHNCVGSISGFCPFNQPSLFIVNMPSCVLALFLSNQKEIDVYCKTVISTTHRVPEIRHVVNGKWLIATAKDLEMEIQCPKQNNPLVTTVVKPVQVVNIPDECVGRTKYFLLPPHYSRKSKVGINDFFDQHSILSKSLLNVWNSSVMSAIDKLNIAPISQQQINHLDKIEKMPVSSLRYMLHNSAQATHEFDADWEYVTLVILQVLFFIGFVTIIPLLVRKLKQLEGKYAMLNHKFGHKKDYDYASIKSEIIKPNKSSNRSVALVIKQTSDRASPATTSVCHGNPRASTSNTVAVSSKELAKPSGIN